ncbi:MAG: hypothetical protein KGY80_10965 [Candidatus Thorarchaeota archaeon]|nr:hypothetical protein [Candidatus Thorarchaeota archaeon]
MVDQSITEEILEAISWASLLSVVTMLFMLFPFLLIGLPGYFSGISNLLLLEFGIMLLIGGCLMGRQPLHDGDRYDSEGKPVDSWRRALIGRKALIASLFVLLLAGVFYLLDSIF